MTGAELLERTDIEAVWAALGGGDLRWGRGRAFWRETRDYNVSLNYEKGVWYDHARSEGGGVLDLVQLTLCGSKADALRWCADHAGVRLDDDRPRDPAEMFDPQKARHFRDALLGHVERGLADYSAALWSDAGADPPQSVQDRVRELTSLRNTLRTCSTRELGTVYVTARKQNPQWAAGLVHAGAVDEKDTEEWTVRCVRLLEAADPRPEHSDAWEPTCAPRPTGVLFDHHPVAEVAP